MIPISNYLKNIAKKISRSITFLGTGPANPITGKKDPKNNRNNTYTLISFDDKKILIDIPKNFDIDPKKIDFLILTHLHQDAFGGFNKIKKEKFILIAPRAITSEIKDHEPIKILNLNEPNKIGITIIPFKVKHDIAYEYATFGYQFVFNDGFKLTYASDMVQIPKESEQYFEDIDLLITDGAGWESNLATHFGIKPFLNLIKERNWKINKIYFTQIGRPVPNYSEAQKEITKINSNAYLTFDGMKIKF